MRGGGAKPAKPCGPVKGLQTLKISDHS
jgi:hypothetical protein